MRRLIKNRLFAATLMFLLLNLAGGFLIMAPLLVLLRNRFDRSAEAFSLWPAIRALTLTDIFLNDTQMMATFVMAAIVIFMLFMLLKTFFGGGIYGIIIFRQEFDAISAVNPFKDFLRRSADAWPGLIKVSLFSIIVYLMAAFIGGIVSQVLSALGFFWQAVFFIFFLLIGSTYVQILNAKIVASGDSSVRAAIRSTRPEISKSAMRLVAGNLSVAIAGAVAAWILWLLLGWIRGHDWSLILAALSIVLEQGIVFVICLMQVIRINYNYSIIGKATDVVGRTELG